MCGKEDEGDSRSSFGKLNDPGKSALRGLGILPQQLTTSPLFATADSLMSPSTVGNNAEEASP
jgi:hypothetical protein